MSEEKRGKEQEPPCETAVPAEPEMPHKFQTEPEPERARRRRSRQVGLYRGDTRCPGIRQKSRARTSCEDDVASINRPPPQSGTRRFAAQLSHF
jgi:hypothetical protein